MVRENKIKAQKNVFLSASVPIEGREYFGTEDVIAIRDSVIALTSVVLSRPEYHLIWGGHPSITPLISLVLERFNLKMSNRVTLYQSEYFKEQFSKEYVDVGICVTTNSLADAESSLRLMREKMLGENEYEVAVFIGGMNGVLEEYKMIRNYHPTVRCLPVASTGAASRYLYDANPEVFDHRLLTELSYASLFKELIIGV